MSYERFEKARVIGSRALQIQLGAPPMVTVKGKENALDIAKIEFEKDVIPITVIRK